MESSGHDLPEVDVCTIHAYGPMRAPAASFPERTWFKYSAGLFAAGLNNNNVLHAMPSMMRQKYEGYVASTLVASSRSSS